MNLHHRHRIKGLHLSHHLLSRLFRFLLLCFIIIGNQEVNSINVQEDSENYYTPVVVQIPQYGKVIGRREEDVDVWRGIPYAAPPVGTLRFASPERPAPWAPSPLLTTNAPPDCIQIHDPLSNPAADESKMSEDCLYMNIYAPAGSAKQSSRKPVMLWIHGGAFQQGSASRLEYNGRNLANQGVVLVSINYRLGPLGWLYAPNEKIYGNMGLLDQYLALTFISEIIPLFGGDPDNITIFGESAGGFMVGLHGMNLDSREGHKRLFHKMILQSSPMGYTLRTPIVASFLSSAFKKSLDCRTLQCLQSEPVSNILDAQRSLMGVPRSVGDFFTWGPVRTVHGRGVTVDLGGVFSFGGSRSNPILYKGDDPSKKRRYILQSNDEHSVPVLEYDVAQPLLTTAQIPADIPIMIGTNANEGELFVHSAFPVGMPKTVYWMFAGALFRDSASVILRHYREYVDALEAEALELATKAAEEADNKKLYQLNKQRIEEEYQLLLRLNATQNLGSINMSIMQHFNFNLTAPTNELEEDDEGRAWKKVLNNAIKRIKKDRQTQKTKIKLKVDYRPVMSRIINDYLFRCPSWHYATLISQERQALLRQVQNHNVTVAPVYNYRFTHPTHIPGYKECWGKACHTAELPYVFQSLDVIQSNYSMSSEWAEVEAPPPLPDYPFTHAVNAIRDNTVVSDGQAPQIPKNENEISTNMNNSLPNRMDQGLKHLAELTLGNPIREADEALAEDMCVRWASFAKTGNPNSIEDTGNESAFWREWMKISNTENRVNDGNVRYDYLKDWEMDYTDDYEYYDPEYDDEIFDGLGEADFSTSPRYKPDIFKELNLEVVNDETEPFRNEFRRLKPSKNDKDFMFELKNLFSKQGTISEEERRKLSSTMSQKEQEYFHYFKELLDLRWPPESRLIEMDCTCDMWDKIRYRY